jgi:hypothetical protein
MPSHLLRCQGLAVYEYGFALGRLEAGEPSTFAHLGLNCLHKIRHHNCESKHLVYRNKDGKNRDVSSIYPFTGWLQFDVKRPRKVRIDAPG